MKRVITLVLIVSFGFTIWSCHNTPWNPDVHPSLPPNILYFQIKQNGNKLEDTLLNKIKLYYLFDGNKIDRLSSTSDDTSFVFPAWRYTGGIDNVGVLASPYAAYLVKDKSSNTMYLEYPNGDVDTLYVEIGNLDYKDAIKDRCYCEDPFTKVMFNGKIAPEATDLHPNDGRPVFVFEK